MCAANVTDAEIVIVNAIEKALQNDFTTKFSLPVLVRLYGINMHRLTEIFLLVTGFTITHYRMLQRVEAAKKLLTTTNESIEAIAVQVGYEGARALAKVFKKLTGKTPHEYREMNK
jgi:transcriptional regulator GlxA family with amidase domain